jgi:hypothetical protein
VILLPTLLTDLEIDEVSLVEQGANNKKIIFKSAQFEDSIMSTVNDKPEADDLEKSAEDVEKEAMEGEGGAGAAAVGATKEEGEEKEEEEKEEGEDKEPAEKSVSRSLMKKMAKTEKALEKARVDAEKARVEKAKLAKEVEDLRKAFADEQSQRILKEHVEKAATEYTRLGKPEEIALITKEASEKLSPEAYGKLSDVLKAANTRIEAAMFQEVGKSGSVPGGSVVEKVRAIAKSYVEKSAGSLTMAQAEAKAWADNPDLYMQYQSEKRKAL